MVRQWFCITAFLQLLSCEQLRQKWLLHWQQSLYFNRASIVAFYLSVGVLNTHWVAAYFRLTWTENTKSWRSEHTYIEGKKVLYVLEEVRTLWPSTAWHDSLVFTKWRPRNREERRGKKRSFQPLLCSPWSEHISSSNKHIPQNILYVLNVCLSRVNIYLSIIYHLTVRGCSQSQVAVVQRRVLQCTLSKIKVCFKYIQ